ncbi:alpha/beta fold hydrolase [Ensifer sp.]|jgi:pimeloyl-ACP methyl ester carboxylesterase|uniref:alpha/beta fold hydrolase n=1 Tax=Ensifer sp. TaxID=1872086 RepID=UPI002E12CB7E|nr:alpha/beta fold hydrolase [Ensifer sp.]
MEQYREHRFQANDGLQLYARRYAPVEISTAIPVVCLPGLTRNSRDFHALALFLTSSSGGSHPVVSLDYRGRGNAARDPDKSNYSIAVETRDVVTACAHFGIERACFIGTSRGGLILHQLIEVAPDLIAAAVLNDIGPVIEIAGLLAIRDYLNAPHGPTRWAEAPNYLRTVHGADFPILGASDWEQMARAIYRDEAGIPCADFDPAIALPLRGLTGETSLPTLWPQLEALAERPLMVVRGEHSKLLSQTIFDDMRRRNPKILAHTALGQGHAPLLHLDGPRQAVTAFADSIA